MRAIYPQGETDDTRFGTATHWAAVELVADRQVAIGTTAPNGVVIDDEALQCATLYARDIEQMLEKYPTGALTVEHTLPAGTISPHCWGTPDAFLWVEDRRRLILWDLKTGHRYVEVVDLPQLTCYADEIITSLGLDDLAVVVEFRIVQPRSYTPAGPIRKWAVKASDLRASINQLANSARAALLPNPVATTGEHCRDCAGRHACPAARNAAMSAVDCSGSYLPENMTPEAVSFELDLLERARDAIDARYTGVLQVAESMARANKDVPGWGMQDTLGRRTWKSAYSINDIEALGKSLGVELVKKVAITPTQARNANVDEAVINAYSEVPKNGMKLVRKDIDRIVRILSGGNNV